MAYQSISMEWINWTQENLDRKCNAFEIRDILRKNNFAEESIREMMGDRYPVDFTPPQAVREQGAPNATYVALCEIPLIKLGRFKNVQRFDTPLLQLITLDEFMTAQECEHMCRLINSSLRESTITYGEASFRTSKTCDLSYMNDPFVGEIDQRIADALGISLSYSEGIQGQRYDVGQQFKAHTDYFEPNTQEYTDNCQQLGNRTWTFMIYLNETEKGGGTRFSKLEHIFYPKTGSCVVWNNRDRHGGVNGNTLHAGMPVEAGEKLIITKWFRERGEGKMFS